MRARILGKKLLPSIREALSEIRREEFRRKVMLKLDPDRKSAIENSALATMRNDFENDRKKWPLCDHCKEPWHTCETCWNMLKTDLLQALTAEPSEQQVQNRSNNLLRRHLPL